MITGNPYLMQQLLFASIQRALQEAARDEIIAASVESAEAGAAVTIDTPMLSATEEDFLSPLVASLLRLTPGTLILSTEGERTIFRYRFSGGI